MAAQLAKVAPQGDGALVDGWVVLSGVPGSTAKVAFRRTSGGDVDARATIDASTW